MSDSFFQPVSGFDLPRFAGVPTFMRLPYVPLDDPRIGEVGIGLVGAPWDGGTSNRPGPRHAPRQLRDLSTMVRTEHGVTGVRPFELVNCADLGDVGPNPGGPRRQPRAVHALLPARQRGGGDPADRRRRPSVHAADPACALGLILFDSHTDRFQSYYGGYLYMHGTPFRRAVEEGLIDTRRIVMIGMRGTTYDSEDRRFADSAGIRVIPIEEYFRRGIGDVMVEACAIVANRPTYVSFDIDFIDPAFAPGTGTPEVGGPSSFEALQVVRALADVNIVGADLVEVSPPFDPSGATAWLGASLMFALLCVMAQGIARGNGRQRMATGEQDGRNLYDQLLLSPPIAVHGR
jgi:guanidinopropionase